MFPILVLGFRSFSIHRKQMNGNFDFEVCQKIWYSEIPLGRFRNPDSSKKTQNRLGVDIVKLSVCLFFSPLVFGAKRFLVTELLIRPLGPNVDVYFCSFSGLEICFLLQTVHKSQRSSKDLLQQAQSTDACRNAVSNAMHNCSIDDPSLPGANASLIQNAYISPHCASYHALTEGRSHHRTFVNNSCT